MHDRSIVYVLLQVLFIKINTIALVVLFKQS